MRIRGFFVRGNSWLPVSFGKAALYGAVVALCLAVCQAKEPATVSLSGIVYNYSQDALVAVYIGGKDIGSMDGTAVPVLSNGVVSLDPATKEASVNGDSPLQLSNREFSLLQALLVRPGAILSRSELEDRIYGWGEEVESNAVEYLIHALRRKLGSEVIKNVRGVGWMVSKSA